MTQDGHINGLVLLKKVLIGFDLAVQGDDMKSIAGLSNPAEQAFNGTGEGIARCIFDSRAPKKTPSGSPRRSFNLAVGSCSGEFPNAGVINPSGSYSVNSITCCDSNKFLQRPQAEKRLSGCPLSQGFLVLCPEEFFRDPVIDKIPGEDFFERARAINVEVRVEVHGTVGLRPVASEAVGG